MRTQTLTHDPEDPLQGFSGLTLFPRTLAAVPNPPQPCDPDDLHHAHNFLKSMPLQSSNKLLEQAKAIVDGISGLSNVEIASNVPSKDGNTEVVQNPRERRPAVDRKLARFSLKPNSSHLNLEPDKLKDPEEFFKAYENLESKFVLILSFGISALQSPIKLLEQAKAIVDSISGLSNLEIASKDENEVAASEIVENPRERRPALGRKRPRFSCKPNSSHLNLELTLDIDKLKDPEEFFKAYENLEDAKREIQKQTGGVLMDLNQLNPSMAARPRRPGLLGRSVKYKHRYPIDISSQETFEENVPSPSNYNVLQETTNPNVQSLETELVDAELRESELVGAVSKEENRVSELLNELLTCEDEEFDEDATVALLQERLQIKPIDPGKLSLPDLQDVRRIDLKASGVDLPKRRNPLSDIHNLVKGMSSRTPKKRKSSESAVPCLASPTPPRSPLAAIISLKKHILHSNLSIDPFSAHDIDQSPARNTSSFGSVEKQIDGFNLANDFLTSPKLKSPMIEENDIADVHTSLPEVDMGDAIHLSDKTVNDNLSRLDSRVDVGSSGFLADLLGSVGDSYIGGNKVVNDISGRPDAGTNAQTKEPAEFNDKVEDVLQKAVDSVQPDLNMDYTAENLNNTRTELDQTRRDIVEDHAIDGSSKTADAGLPGPHHHNSVKSVQPDLNMEDFTVKKLNSTQTDLDQTRHDLVEDHAMDEPSKTADACPQQHNEEVQKLTGEPSNKQSKTISRPRRKGKHEVATRRQSLAASGTSWESGVRRSTRIKSRPLEYWKGERFLYGRVHESLTTVIGIKYDSPGNADGKPGIKVKSFVSDKYKDLVELAARF